MQALACSGKCQGGQQQLCLPCWQLCTAQQPRMPTSARFNKAMMLLSSQHPDLMAATTIHGRSHTALRWHV